MSNLAMVIPARLGSTRLPRKALADIGGEPMVVRTARAASRLPGLSRLLVATDSLEIKAAVEKAGFEARMTPEELRSGTERVAFVARDLSEKIIINVQGDEPFLEPEAIQAALDPVVQRGRRMGSVYTAIRSWEEAQVPSMVKVLVDQNADAIYFSRYAIPFRQGALSDEEILSNRGFGRHLGIYVYERSFLLEYVTWEQPLIERAESLEQLRVLQRGEKIGMGFTHFAGLSIDTPEDLEAARAEIRTRDSAARK